MATTLGVDFQGNSSHKTNGSSSSLSFTRAVVAQLGHYAMQVLSGEQSDKYDLLLDVWHELEDVERHPQSGDGHALWCTPFLSLIKMLCDSKTTQGAPRNVMKRQEEFIRFVCNFGKLKVCPDKLIVLFETLFVFFCLCGRGSR